MHPAGRRLQCHFTDLALHVGLFPAAQYLQSGDVHDEQLGIPAGAFSLRQEVDEQISHSGGPRELIAYNRNCFIS